jgi:hypothetical protein
VSGAGAKVGFHHDTEEAMQLEERNELTKTLAEAAKELAKRAADAGVPGGARELAEAAAALAHAAIAADTKR